MQKDPYDLSFYNIFVRFPVRVYEAIEAGLSAFFAALLALMLPINWAVEITEPKREDLLIPLLLIPLVALELYAVYLIFRSLFRKSGPFGPRTASQHVRFPLPLAIPVSIYWFCHFLSGIILALIVSIAPPAREENPYQIFFISFVLTAAANVHLLLSVAAINPKSTFIDKLWRHRFLLDVLMSFGAFLILSL
jgi:hypothetical protein